MPFGRTAEFRDRIGPRAAMSATTLPQLVSSLGRLLRTEIKTPMRILAEVNSRGIRVASAGTSGPRELRTLLEELESSDQNYAWSSIPDSTEHEHSGSERDEPAPSRPTVIVVQPRHSSLLSSFVPPMKLKQRTLQEICAVLFGSASGRKGSFSLSMAVSGDSAVKNRNIDLHITEATQLARALLMLQAAARTDFDAMLIPDVHDRHLTLHLRDCTCHD